LPLGPRPVVQVGPKARLVIRKLREHALVPERCALLSGRRVSSGLLSRIAKPHGNQRDLCVDASGDHLREWLAIV
ncbi:MAG: hypothetical protein AAFY60_01780, partial [Myxococcota bacterium]